MAEIEKGGIPVIPLRGTGQFNPDGVRDYDLLVPASAEALVDERHAADRERYLAEAARWREAYIAEHGVKPPETLRPMPGSAPRASQPPVRRRTPSRRAVRALLQRTTGARVRVGGEVVGEIGGGLVVLLGVGPDDDEAIADALARRVTELRIFDDADGRTNLLAGRRRRRGRSSSASSRSTPTRAAAAVRGSPAPRRRSSRSGSTCGSRRRSAGSA